MLNAGADIEAKDDLNFTALNVAKYHKNDEIIKLLENAGAKENPITTPSGLDGSYESQREFYWKLSKRIRTWNDEPVLYVYADNGVDLGLRAHSFGHITDLINSPLSLERAKFVIYNGVDPNTCVEARTDRTVLHQMVRFIQSKTSVAPDREATDYIDAIIYLLENGADPNLTNSLGNTPFMHLFNDGPKVVALPKDKREKMVGHIIRVIKAFIVAGADVNTQGERGFTPLHLAIQWQDAQILKLLLEAGANPLAVNDDGKTPYDMLKPEDFPNFSPEFTKLLDTHFKPQP
jgi:ankyrin repeat protein